MNPTQFARVAAAGALAAALAVAACANDQPTTTTEQIQAASVYHDADVVSALVAGNYAIAQVATGALGAFASATDGGLVVDPNAPALATQEQTDANAALVRLYGTADIDPNGTAAAPGGLTAGLNGGLVSNPLTDAINTQATADAATVAGSSTPDLDYAKVALAENQALLDVVDSALASADGGLPDAGYQITSDALRTELATEQTSLQGDLNAAQTEIDSITGADAGASASASSASGS